MSTYVISSKLLNQTRELTPTEKVLVVAIQSLSKERGYCYATNTYLADSLGKDKTTISKSLPFCHFLGGSCGIWRFPG